MFSNKSDDENCYCSHFGISPFSLKFGDSFTQHQNPVVNIVHPPFQQHFINKNTDVYEGFTVSYRCNVASFPESDGELG